MEQFYEGKEHIKYSILILYQKEVHTNFTYLGIPKLNLFLILRNTILSHRNHFRVGKEHIVLTQLTQ